MKTAAAAAALPFLALLALSAPAQAVPNPNEIRFECADDKIYTGTAGSQMTVAARFRTPEGPAVGSVKGAEGYPDFTGVPSRLLTTCAVYKNGEYFVEGFVLLVGPGSRTAG